jgi:hypothetical protein
MTRTRPFTLLAAIIFGLMALVHLYRLLIHPFPVMIGNHPIGQTISIVAIAITALLSVMLFRESRAP